MKTRKETTECILCLRSFLGKKLPSNKHSFQDYLMICKKYLTIAFSDAEFDQKNEIHPPICTVCFYSVETLYQLHDELQKMQTKLIEYSITLSEVLNQRRSNVESKDGHNTDDEESCSVRDIKIDLEKYDIVIEEDHHEESLMHHDEDSDHILHDVEDDEESVSPPPGLLDQASKTEEFSINETKATTTDVLDRPQAHLKHQKDKSDVKIPKTSKNLDRKTKRKTPILDNASDNSVNSEQDDDQLTEGDSNGVLFGCWNCSKKFRNKEDYDAHSRLHMQEESGELICGTCGKQFATKYTFRKHQDVHANLPKTLVCTFCGKMFAKKEYLSVHEKVFHTNTLKKSYNCDICEKSFLRLKYLLCHKKYVHGDGQRKLTNSGHNQGHRKKNTFCCEVCGKVFTVKINLDDHRRIHTGEKPYKCDKDDCEVACRTRVQRRTHIIRHHSDDFKFVCPNDKCDKKYKFQYELKIHLPTHNIQDKVSCDKCDKKFNTRRRVTLHKRLVHFKESWPYICGICGGRQSSKVNHENHVRTHTGEQPFECSQCHKRFISKSRLRAHRKEKGHFD